MTPLAALRAFVRPVRWGGFRRAGSSRRSRARSSVANGLLLAAAINAGLAVAVESRRPEWRDPEFFHRQKRLVKLVRWEREQGHARPLVVVIGGSRPQMGLSPEHLGLGHGPADPLVFDLVQSGTVPVGVRLNAARTFAAGLRPDFVLLEVLPPVLVGPESVEGPLPPERLGVADLARSLPYHSQPARTVGTWALARAAPASSLRVPLLAHWGLADAIPAGPAHSDFLWRDMRPSGWSPYYPATWTAADWEPRLAATRKAYTRMLAGRAIRPENDRAIADALADCRARGVKAALFAMPESAGFRAVYSPGLRAHLAAHIAALAREHGVPVFDASNWDYPEAAYMDGHHLLGPAAEAFSRRFGRECVGPWLGVAPAGGN